MGLRGEVILELEHALGCGHDCSLVVRGLGGQCL